MKEFKRLLQNAVDEIKFLRRQNEMMTARLDVFDSMMAILHTDIARKNQGMIHPDIAYEIEEFLSKKEEKDEIPI